MSGELTRAPTLAEVRQLQAAIEQMPQVEVPVVHHWADGIYGREARIPAGAVVVGKMHRDATLNILAAGEIAVTGPNGAVQVMRAPAVFTSPPNTKKVGLALTDVVWINVHPTKLRDVAAIESKFIVPETPAIEEEI